MENIKNGSGKFGKILLLKMIIIIYLKSKNN